MTLETNLSAVSPQNRTRYILDTYLRRTNLYNVILLRATSRVKKEDAVVCKRLFSGILRSKDRGIRNKTNRILIASFQITPVSRKLELDVRNLVRKLKRIGSEDNLSYQRNITKVRKRSKRIL